MTIDRDALIAYLAALDGADTLRMEKATFHYHDPQRRLAPDKRQPFATVVWTDEWDQASNLEGRGLYRLNVGLAQERYHRMLGEPPAWGAPPPGDLSTIDAWRPHPHYAPMHWVGIVAPEEARWPEVRELVAESQGIAKRLYARGSTSS